MSIFEGKLDEIPDISIDKFRGHRSIEGSTAYFLSHCRTDHMVGLSDEEFRKALFRHENIFLYTSKITRCILKNDRNFHQLAPKIWALPSQQFCRISVPSLSDPSSSKDVHVTLIPAAHCPGSVMFFFESEEGNVLYTGDFRLSLNDIYSISELHQKSGEPKEINACYLDATFFDEIYWRFPKREDSWKQICDLIKDWLGESHENEVLIDVPANYGAEFIFREIQKELVMKVHVTNDKFNKFLSVREISEAITIDGRETRVHSCCTSMNDRNTLRCKRINHKNFLRIRVSCLWYQKEHALKGVVKKISPMGTTVCYACHCSYEELVDFLKHFLPRKVIACAIPPDKRITEVEHKIEEILQSERLKREMNPTCSGDSDDNRIGYLQRSRARKLILSSPRKKRSFIHVPEDESSGESFPRSIPSRVGKEEQDTSKKQINTATRPYQISKFSLESGVSSEKKVKASRNKVNTVPVIYQLPKFSLESGSSGEEEQDTSSTRVNTEPVSLQASKSTSGSGDSGEIERRSSSKQVNTAYQIPESTSESGDSGEKEQNILSSQVNTVSGSHQVPEKLDPVGSSCESDFEPSPSLLPQFSRSLVDPTNYIFPMRGLSDCLVVSEGKGENEIEIITLSSDESPEIFVMD